MESPLLRDKVDFAVMVAVCHHADATSAECWAGRETIARGARLSVRCTEQALERLVEAGLLSVKKQGGGRKNRTSYVVHVPEITAQNSEHRSPFIDLDGEKNSEHGAPFMSETANTVRPLLEKTANAVRPFGEETANATTKTEPETANATTSYKEKSFINSKEECENARTRGAPLMSPASPANPTWDKPPPATLPGVLATAICEVCQLDPANPGTNSAKQLPGILAWLREQCPGQPDNIIADEVRRRFTTNWEMDSAPFPSQIQSFWKRQEVKPNGTNNNRPLNRTQAIGRQRRALQAELAVALGSSLGRRP